MAVGAEYALVLCALFLSISTFLDDKHLAEAFLEHHNPHAAKQHFLPHEHTRKHNEALRHAQGTFSVVIDPAKPHLNSFVRIVNLVEVFDGGKHRAHIEYFCGDDDLVAVQIFLQSDDIPENPLRVYHHDWACSSYSSGTRSAYVRLTLPDWLTYRPDNLQPLAFNVIKLEMKVWILNKQQIVSCVHWNNLNCYERAHVKVVYPIKMLPVYQRQRRNYEVNMCLSWDSRIKLNYFNEEKLLSCELEKEIVQLVDFPVAFSDANSGIIKELPSFQDIGLINQQLRHRFNPQFTISTTLYLLEYCRSDLCGIIHRKSQKNNNYVTPLLFLTRKGLIHIQVVLENGQAFGMLSNYQIPLKRWVRLVYKQDGSKWTLSVSSGHNLTNVVVSSSLFPNPVRYEEGEGLIYLGGSVTCKAFRGFIADTWMWRTAVTKKDPNWNSSSSILMDKLSSYFTSCDELQERMKSVYEKYHKQRLALIQENSCDSSLLSLLKSLSSDIRHPVCQPWERRPPKGYRHLWASLRKAVWRSKHYQKSYEFIGGRLHENAIQYLAAGLSTVPDLLSVLRQASCYGNHKSSYMLGTLYAGGINVDADQNEAYLYWLVAAQEGNRLAMLALANHHSHGINAASNDYDFAFNYLKRLADLTIKDRERHDPDGVLTEYVRLTDPDALQVHKGEHGDHFLWLKYQATKGIAHAQLDIARILFWGQGGINRDVHQAVDLYRLYLMENPLDEVVHYDYGIVHLQASMARLKFWGLEGVKRDMKTAVKYYEKSVREMPRNRVALYDYGIVLLRGQGTEKNVLKALEHLNKSAELGHAPAYTALGWYAINFQRDMKAAARYFDTAAKMGHRDAMHNLGYMYKSGQYPGKPADEVKALLYFQKAADHGHIDSAGVVAEIYNQGSTGVERSSFKAVAWSRLVCEQNPEIGMALRKGLDAFLAGSWGESIMYYMMVAETGVEVAQFNLAHLCEEDHDGQVSAYVRTDCVWKYYNLSSQAVKPHIISQLKMGDFHYYGHHGKQDKNSAVWYYAKAAKRREPQALFNLAYLVEEGTVIDTMIWRSLHISSDVYKTDDKTQLIMTLYRRCRDGGNPDSYLPCSLALVRVQLVNLWGKHAVAVQVSGALLVSILTLHRIVTCLRHIRQIRCCNTPSQAPASCQRSED